MVVAFVVLAFVAKKLVVVTEVKVKEEGRV